MAISRVKTWSSGEVLTASDLNAEFNNVLNNGSDLVSPFTKAISMGGFALNFDAANTIALTGATNGVSLTGGALNTPQGADIASAATLNLDTATGNTPDVTGVTTITAVTLSQGRWRLCRFTGVLTITNGASLVVEGGADFTTVAGQYVLFVGYASSVVRCIPFVTPAATQTLTNKTIGITNTVTLKDTLFTLQDDGDATKQLQLQLSGITTATTRTLTPQDQNFTIGSVARGHLSGLAMSTAGSSATMTVAAGQATDSTNVMMMVLASSIAKTTSAWAVGSGNGGKLTAGAVANSTWYHFYEIFRSDTGVVDVGFDISATVATLPTGYTHYRRIGAGKTDGSAQWTSFIQYGDEFYWLAPVSDISANNPGTSAVSRTLTVPTGLQVKAIVGVRINTTSGTDLYLSSLDQTDTAASSTLYTHSNFPGSTAGNNQVISSKDAVWTNTSAQVRSRFSVSDGNLTFGLITHGWIDRRGRDS